MQAEQTLLVVDDEDAICEGCSRIFSRQGFEVQKCNNAGRGLELARQGNYSAILLDIKMPEMDGLHFLEALRKERPDVPVVLMTGYPSIPNAASAIRLGASDYVTKPFTPEEISQAVHRLLHENQEIRESDIPTDVPASGQAFYFYRDAWYQACDNGAVRAGAMLVRPGTMKIQSVRLPKIGEVVYQGLPLASVVIKDQTARIVPAPVSGVIVAINENLEKDPALLLSDPCDKGWIASIRPTRLEEESGHCVRRCVVLLSQDFAAREEQAQRLRWLGCEVHTAANVSEAATILKNADTNVLLFDAKTFDTDGPQIVGEIKTENPEVKIIVLASTGSILEPAYRIRRIFYYAVEPFADNEIADILAAAFQKSLPTTVKTQKELAQPLGGIFITNRNKTRVRLVASPGLLRREQGLGLILRQKLMKERFPLESTPGEIPITPMNLLSMTAYCDRLIVLLAQDHGRLPGSLTRDTKAEYIAMVGAGADKVTTLLVQPSEVADNPLAFDPYTLDALADHLLREMASC